MTELFLSCSIFIFVFLAGHLLPTVFQQEPCLMRWWRGIFLTVCSLVCCAYLTAFPDSHTLCFLLPYDLLIFSPPNFYFFYLKKKKIPILLHLPWLSSTSQWLPVFECLPRAGHQWGWRTHVFAAAAWAQNPHFRWRSCCLLATVCVFMSYHLDRSPVRAEVEREKDLEVVSSSSVVEGLCPQGWVRYTALQHHNLYFPGI